MLNLPRRDGANGGGFLANWNYRRARYFDSLSAWLLRDYLLDRRLRADEGLARIGRL